MLLSFLEAAVPVLGSNPLPPTVKDLLSAVDGLKSKVNPSKLAEGVVFHHPTGKTFHPLGHRSNFKAVSRAYEAKLPNRDDE